jgi:UPF0716 protein FxsA
MNSFIFFLISIPLIEIYLFIKVGSHIGALNTISLIIITAIIGVFYARYEGFNTLRSGMSQLMKNQLPLYEIISGAALAFAAILLILPGFATDILGFLLIFPPTRKLFFKNVTNNYSNEKKTKQDFINGEFEDIDEDKNGKV